MKNIDGIIAMVATALIGFVDFLYGGGELVYLVLMVLMISTLLDWNSGRRAAKKDGVNASEYGIDGIWRTGQIYLILALGHWIDKTFLLNNFELVDYQLNGAIFYLFAAGIFVDTLKSVTANHARLGWDNRIPSWALDWVANEIENKIARARERREKIVKHQPGE